MATLMIIDTSTSSATLMPRKTSTLREWLAGDWAALFSDPEQFAPHPTTPAGFITLLAQDFSACGVKPIKVGTCGDTAANWLNYAGSDCANVIIDSGERRDQVVDLMERTLAMTIERLDTPFVIVLDPKGRCRSTLTYRHCHGERSRTIEGVLSIVHVLQAGAPVRPSQGYASLAAG